MRTGLLLFSVSFGAKRLSHACLDTRTWHERVLWARPYVVWLLHAKGQWIGAFQGSFFNVAKAWLTPVVCLVEKLDSLSLLFMLSGLSWSKASFKLPDSFPSHTLVASTSLASACVYEIESYWCGCVFLSIHNCSHFSISVACPVCLLTCILCVWFDFWFSSLQKSFLDESWLIPVSLTPPRWA